MQTPIEKAEGSKGKGNKYFKAGRFEQAIKCYTEAIEVCPVECPQELSTYYQNRAAAHEQMVEIDLLIKILLKLFCCNLLFRIITITFFLLF